MVWNSIDRATRDFEKLDALRATLKCKKLDLAKLPLAKELR